MRVLVLSSIKDPLMPCHPARARELLKKGQAAVFRQYPFTIILKNRQAGICQPFELKIDPGSKATGMTLVADCKKGYRVFWASEVTHRGQAVRSSLAERRAIRKNRRNRKTRYRAPRFLNRTRPEGWLAPSLMSRVYNMQTWAARLIKVCPVTDIHLELNKFDTQLMENPEITGVEYQQGTLVGYEIREYLLEKWGRKCVYCGKENVPLEIEHIIPRSRGGSSRISNLALACKTCNKDKGNMTAEEFGYPEVQKAAKLPLRDAAAMNATRYAIGRALKQTGLYVAFWSGGRTKFNRISQNYPKEHWIDAACIGETGDRVIIPAGTKPLNITAAGHGNRQMCGTNKYGFPIRHRTRDKKYFGFCTGDIAKAIVPKGKYVGTYIGSIAIRASGYFDIKNGAGKRIVQGISHKYFKTVQHFDGYRYETGNAFLPAINCRASCVEGS